MFEHAPIGLAIGDLRGCWSSVNRQLCKMLGYTEAELCSVSYVDLTKDADRHISIDALEKFRSGHREPIEFEKRYVRKDGEIVWAAVVVSAVDPDCGGDPIVIAQIRDETARRKSEQSRQRLIAVLEETPDFVAITDTSLRVVFLNRKAREIAGAECLGRDIMSMHDTISRSQVQHAFAAAIRDGVWRGEVQMSNGAGEKVPVSLICLAHRDSDGQLQYVSTTARDISDRRRYEKTRKELLHKLLVAEAEERRRIARELHDEAGQALTSLLLHLEILEPSCKCIDSRGIAKIRSIATETIENLSRLARGLHPSVLDDLGLAVALQKIGKSHGPQNRIQICVDVNGLTTERLPLPVETAAYRIVQEAMTNAIKHSEATYIHISAENDTKILSARVQDNGHGFDVRSRTPGIGLVSMRERAELLGGSLQIQSNSAGTCVSVELPINA